MNYAIAVIQLAALFHTSLASKIIKRSADYNSPQQCSYSFDVPASADETCPSSAPSIGNLTALEVAISTQHADLEAKLNAILARLQLEDSSSAEDTSSSDSRDRDGGGVNYKRWGRTTCPATATLVYAGECVHVPV